jgi:hypothetical protein
MHYSLITAVIILVAAIGGFVVLARTLLDNWRARSRGKAETEAHQSAGNRGLYGWSRIATLVAVI